MNNMSEHTPTDNEENVEFDEGNGSDLEALLTALIKSYEDSYNYHNKDHQISFQMTVTIHDKIATQDGNKDIAYLRLDRIVLDKDKNEVGAPQLVLQQTYTFKDLKARLNPNNPWRDTLYMQTLHYLVAGGLEYAEFMRRAKRQQESMKEEAAKVETTEEDRLAKLGMVKAAAHTDDIADKEYKKWLKAERAKEGL